MITNPRFDAGRFRAPADDAVSVLLEGLKVAKPEISAKDGSPRKRVRPLSVYSEDPELAFVHAAQTRVGANSPLPNGWFLLGR